MLDGRVAQRQIGRRVKAARAAMGWNQDRLADEMRINDRQTISDIENGKRSLTSEELVSLSTLFGKDVEFFLDPFVVAGEAQFTWRADLALDNAKLVAFEQFSGPWIGLLRWMRCQSIERISALKRALKFTPYSTYKDAGVSAERLVTELSFGKTPGDDLALRIEQKLDIPILFVDPKAHAHVAGISGAACHLEDLTVLLVNRRENVGRRNFDIAHELFHALTWDALGAVHRESNAEPDAKAKKIERLADNFAASLLMPSGSLKEFGVEQGCEDLDLLERVAGEFRVTPKALGWRLLNLGLIDDEVRERLSLRKLPASPDPKLFSQSFVILLHRAIDSGRLSLRKAAKTMGFSIHELESLFADYGLSSPNAA